MHKPFDIDWQHTHILAWQLWEDKSELEKGSSWLFPTIVHVMLYSICECVLIKAGYAFVPTSYVLLIFLTLLKFVFIVNLTDYRIQLHNVMLLQLQVQRNKTVTYKFNHEQCKWSRSSMGKPRRSFFCSNYRGLHVILLAYTRLKYVR